MGSGGINGITGTSPDGVSIYSAAVLVSIDRSTNSVGLPTTASSGFIYYLHQAVRRLSGTAMYRIHFPKPPPWRGRAVDRITTVHIAQWQAHSTWTLQCTRWHEPTATDGTQPYKTGHLEPSAASDTAIHHVLN